ncbi:MAG: hypothetical protein FJY80_14390, partial [Candidatus Aminicenantes bacterium]|nr:hypothetical protein [Candidatus Aminicenantes bacterium]
MRLRLPFVASLLFLAVSGLSAQSVTSPAAAAPVAPARDYAAEVLLDRWDMNQRTDLGWRIFNTIELPLSNLTNISFAGGLFSADTTGDDVNISILDSSYAGSAMQVGKFGKAFPIDANTYTVFAIRMYVGPGSYVHPMFLQAFLYWSKDTIYNDTTWAKNWRVYEGWAYYIINIPTMVPLGGSALPWSGAVDSLRFDPFTITGRNVKIDWIRLVQNTGGLKTISWTGFGGNVDIYLDDDTNAGNGNLGLLARDQTGPNYQFLADALSYGTYYVAIAPTGTTSYVYSPGYYAVGEQPIVRVDKPSAEGSDQDYVTVNWSDPWDMANAADVEVAENVTGGAFQTVNYEDLAGTAYASQTAYVGNAAIAPPEEWGDPIVRLLHFWPPTRRGAVSPVDTSKYHNLVVKMGVWGTHDTAGGSIARVVWKLTTELLENVTQDIIVRHLDGKWIMNKIVCDLKTIPLEDGAGSPSHTGWTGLADVFRVDPHEFPDGRAFFIDDVKLTADWRADSSFQITGAFFDSDSSATMALYYDTDRSGYDGTLIAGGIAVGAGGGAP